MPRLIDRLASKDGLEKFAVFERHLKQKAWQKGIPLYGLFELTPRCTLNCAMCYVQLSDGQMKRKELTAAQWMALIGQAADAGMMFATLTGGECLMVPGFKQIYEHLQSLGVLVTILTNGTLLDEAMVDYLAARTPQRIQVSVYGSSPEGYRAVTGSGEAFYKVDRALDLLGEAGLPYNIAVTASRQMMEDFEATIRYCQSKNAPGIRVNTCPFESREETGREFDDYAPTLDEQVEIIRTLRRLTLENLEESCADEIHVSQNREERAPLPEKGIVCSAGRNSFSIDWQGRMLPCSVFDFAACHPLENGFLNSWRELNRRCVAYKNPAECVGCAYFSACRFCPAGHYLKAGEGRANTDVCDEGRRMVAEGLRSL